ncbi:MAG: DUF2927 domain-containing protein [Clostridia bacterium]|nr:DUF2927 domain-containing protein [Clostridia bacterium]
MKNRAAALVLLFLFLFQFSACTIKKNKAENTEPLSLSSVVSEKSTFRNAAQTVIENETTIVNVSEKHTSAPERTTHTEETTAVSVSESNMVEEMFTEILSVIKPTTTTTLPAVTQSVRVKGYSQKQLINYFIETAMNSENGINLGRVLKWTKRVNVYVSGNYNDSDLSLIKQLCNALNDIDGFPGISITNSSSDADVLVMFAGRLQLSSLISDFGLFDDGYCGLVWNTSYSLRKAVIGINSTIINRVKRNSVICEEFLQAMGIPNDSNSYKNSIFYQTSDSLTWPSKLDWGVVSILYNPGIKPGMTKSEARETAKTFVKSGV